MENIFRRGALALILCGMLGMTYADPLKLGCEADVETCFSYTRTCEAAIVQLIQQAENRIWLAGYGFTSTNIARAIWEAHARGVEVHLVLDRSNKASRFSQAPYLADVGIDIQIDSRCAIMHHKFIVADEAVGFGSMNFTKAGDQKNAENFNIFRHAPELVRLYEKEFWRLYRESEPLKEHPGSLKKRFY